MKYLETREEIVELAASLFQRGYSVGSAGNISVRVADGYLMTPTNSSLGRLNAQRLSMLDMNWNHVTGDAPSKEVVMHRAMYQANPEIGAIVHLHSTHVTALSCLRHGEEQVLIPHTPYLVMRMGEKVPMVPYYKPGDPEMESDIFEAAKKCKAIILGNHGSIVGGSTLIDAANSAEELEASAQLALLLHGRESRPLTSAEIGSLLNR